MQLQSQQVRWTVTLVNAKREERTIPVKAATDESAANRALKKVSSDWTLKKVTRA